MSNEINIVDYSDKAIVVYGNTKDFKDHFINIKGKWNSNLRDGSGWVFPKSKLKVVEELVDSIKNNKPSVVSKEPEQKYQRSTYVSNNNDLDKKYVKIEMYLSLLSRVEKLEQDMYHISKGTIVPYKETENITFESSDEDEQPVKLMHNKKKK